jgi:hypothetical protein
MLRLWRQFGDALDRSGLAGWVLLLCGFAIIGVTLLAPAWLDVRQLDAQVSVLERQHQLLEMRHQNYRAFVRAVGRSDPMIVQRLAMHQLNLRPAGAQPLRAGLEIDDAATTSQPLEQWMRPTLAALPPETVAIAYPETRLVRLVTGHTRPWTLAFGGWLMLMGLLLNPQAHIAAESDAQE